MTAYFRPRGSRAWQPSISVAAIDGCFFVPFVSPQPSLAAPITFFLSYVPSLRGTSRKVRALPHPSAGHVSFSMVFPRRDVPH